MAGSTFGAAAPASDVELAMTGVAPVPDVVAPVPDVVAPVPESVVLSVASVPPGAFVWLVVPVEGCWLESGSPFVASVPPDVFFAFFAFFPPVEGCGSEALVLPSLCAVESLEGGLAKETAAPGAPINRPAASTQTPAAKRKCDGIMIAPHHANKPRACKIVAVPWVPRESVSQTSQNI